MKIVPISAISSARNMSDPFKWLPSTVQRWVLLISILLSLALLLVMHSLDGQLITAASPRGIVSFELSGSIESAAQILKLWGPQGKVYAALSLGFDYLFLYPVCGLRITSDKGAGIWQYAVWDWDGPNSWQRFWMPSKTLH